MKVLLERFHLNCHTIGFCTRTQKVEPPYYKTRPFTMGVEELNLTLVYSAGKRTQASSRKRILTSFVSTLLFADVSSLSWYHSRRVLHDGITASPSITVHF